MFTLLPCPCVARVPWARKAHVSHAVAGHWAGLPGTRGTVWPPGQVTCLPAKSKLKSFRAQGTALRPGASANVHALLRPSGNPGAGHVPQIDIELQQA